MDQENLKTRQSPSLLLKSILAIPVWPKGCGYMTIIHSLELHHSAKQRQAKKSLWLSCLRIWFWWRLSNYHITHNWGENKIPLLETLTMGSFHPCLYWKGPWQICYTPGQGEDYAHPHSLIPLSRGRGHTAGDAHGQEKRTGRWFGLKFSYPRDSTHGSTLAGSGHISLQAGTNVTCKVRFLSEAPWEEAHGAKFHFLNNSLLAIVKKHKVGEKGGIFIPNVSSIFARQGKAQFCTWLCVLPVLSLLCKTGNCKYPQPAELHSGHPSLTSTHVGTQKTKECTSEGRPEQSLPVFWSPEHSKRSCKAPRSGLKLSKP